MPISLSAHKALRQSRRRAAFNLRIKKKLKSVFLKFRRRANSQGLKDVYQAVDIAKKKHVIHRNKAKRLKSQAARLLAKQVKAKKAKPAAKKKRSPQKSASKK